MINSKLIYKILGQLLFIEAFLLFVSLLVAFYYQQDDIFAFIVATLTTIGGGLVLKWRGHGADNSMSRRDAYLVVTLSWIVFSFFGTLPFMVSGYINNFTDAYFETMSGFTTTGATILDDVECFPHGLLFWRSLTQWIGGLGIVFFTIALLPSLVGGQTKVFAAEATGPIKTKLHPRLSTSAKWIWSIYLMLTIACIAILHFLARQEVCYFGAIHEELPIAKATVSQHLKELKDAGLIQDEIETPKVKYCINRENWEIARQLLAEFFADCVSKKRSCCED